MSNQTNNQPALQNCLVVIGLIVAVMAFIVAILNWLTPFQPVGPSPFIPRITPSATIDVETMTVPTSSIESNPTPNSPNEPAGHIVFSSDQAGGVPEVFVMNADGSNQIQVTYLRAATIAGRVSPDGLKILIGAYPDYGLLKIYTANIDGSDVNELAAVPNANEYPFWDLDSKHAYFSTVSNEGTQLFKIDTITGEQTNVANYEITLGSPSISPDGTRLAFQQPLDSQGHTDIFSISIGGNDILRLTSQVSFSYHAAWSPDGQQIAFASGKIWVMNADGSNQIVLPTGDFAAWTPSWSPDGNWIAFNTAESQGEDDIYIIRTDGTRLTRLTYSSGDDNAASWGP